MFQCGARLARKIHRPGIIREDIPMNMNRVVSLAILAAGILLIIFGIRESESLNSDISRFFSGSPTDRAIWMLIGGVVATIVGLAALSFGRLRGSRGN